MLNIVDTIIIVFLLAGAALGFKRGALKQTVTFVGLIVAFGLAFFLKNPVALFFYDRLPFFPFDGVFKGVKILNIIVYEVIAYVVVLSILLILLKVIKMLTSVFERILTSTIILGIPSKLLGAVIGVLSSYAVLFVALFILMQPVFGIPEIHESKYTPIILEKTPFINEVVDDTIIAFEEIYALKDEYKDRDDVNQLNLEALDILLKYDIITIESVEKLIAKEKIKIDNVSTVLERYYEN